MPGTTPLEKPSFQPPGWVFGAVWTTLYTLMGIALATILDEPPSPRRSIALGLFVAQLALNFAWSPIFFGGADDRRSACWSSSRWTCW